MFMRAMFAVPVLLATGLACGRLTTFPEEDAAIVGRIIARNVQTSISGHHPAVHVKEPSDPECGIIFTVDAETLIGRRKSDGSVEEAAAEALLPGRVVAVWAGLVLESCPAQARAHAIEILSPQTAIPD